MTKTIEQTVFTCGQKTRPTAKKILFRVLYNFGNQVLSINRILYTSQLLFRNNSFTPSLTLICSIFPPCGAEMTISIFLSSSILSEREGMCYIAERTAIGSPFLTVDPTWTLSSTTTPLMGAPTCPGSVGSAFGLEISSVATINISTHTRRSNRHVCRRLG